MSDDLKNKIAANSWLIAIVVGAIGFIAAKSSFTAWNWTFAATIIGAAVVFIVLAFGSWLMASQVVDAYTLDAADNIGDVNRLLAGIQSHTQDIKDPAIVNMLNKICKDTVALVKYTRKSQPNNLLSCATVLEEWLKIVDKNAAKCVDISANAEYYNNPKAKYQTALVGFEGFDTFLVKTIKMIAEGSDVSFENNAKMLDSTRNNIM